MNADICHFVQLHGLEAGQVSVFQSGRIRIGVGPQCDLAVPDLLEGLPSEAAEVLLLDDGDFHINPVQGRVPVLVNGRAITRLTVLRSEDYIRIGEAGPEVLFRHGHPDASVGARVAPEYPVGELRFLDGSLAGQAIEIKFSRPISIGRLPSMDVKLDPRVDITVSGRHCTLRWDDAGAQFIVTDCSRNGTYVDDAPVDGEALVVDGSEIRLSSNGPKFVFIVKGPQRDYPNGSASGSLSAPGVAAFPREFVPSGRVQPDDSSDIPGQGDPGLPSIPDAVGESQGELEEVRIATDPLEPSRVEPAAETVASGGDVATLHFHGRRQEAGATEDESAGTGASPTPRVPNDPPTDPGMDLAAGEDRTQFDFASAERDTVRQPFRPGSSPAYFSDPDSKRAAVNSAGTWPLKGAIGPTVEPPLTARRSSRPGPVFTQTGLRRGRLSDVPIPIGKVPSVPIRINLLRKAAEQDSSPSAAVDPPFSGKKVLQVAGPIAAIVVLLILLSQRGGSKLDPTDPISHLPEPGRSVALAMKKPVTVKNAEGGFSAEIPRGWDHSVVRGVLQASSPDGRLALEMVRYSGLNAEVARRIVGQNGPVSEAQTGGVAELGMSMQTFASHSESGISRVAVLLTPEEENSKRAPLLSFVEAERGDLESLPKQVLIRMMVQGVKITDDQPKAPVAKVVSTPSVEIAAGGQPPATPQPVGDDPPATSGDVPVPSVSLPPAGIVIPVPEGWTGTEDSAAGIVALSSPDGLDIRVTAEDEPPVVDDIFGALRAEGWTQVGTSEMGRAVAGLFRLGTENIVVAFVDRGGLPAGVVYARKDGPWTETQLESLGRIFENVSRVP